MAPLRLPPRIYVPPPLTAKPTSTSLPSLFTTFPSPLRTQHHQQPPSSHPQSPLATTPITQPRAFTTTPSVHLSSPRNRIYNSIRSADDFSSLLSLSTSSNQPLITLWTASWCPSCRFISPLLTQLIEAERCGESSSNTSSSSASASSTSPSPSSLSTLPSIFGSPTSIAFAEIELDSPDIGEVASRYQITSIPLLLAFSRGEAQVETRVGDVRKLKDAGFLREWIRREAGRGGRGGAGGSLFGGLFK